MPSYWRYCIIASAHDFNPACRQGLKDDFSDKKANVSNLCNQELISAIRDCCILQQSHTYAPEDHDVRHDSSVRGYGHY